MPLTVWGAFDQFRKNTVDLDQEMTKRARSSRDYLFEQLKQLASSDSGFPRLFGTLLPFGSFARNTKIRPLDDVDVLLLLNGRGTTACPSQGDPFTYWLKIDEDAAPLALFPDGCGYVNSTKILNKIKGSLSTVPNYRKAEIHKNLQAVTLNLVSYEWVFDIVPAVPINDWGGKTACFLIPNGRGNWIRTDPRIDSGTVTRVNAQHNGELLPTIRLLKRWNRRVHKPVLASYYFETLALKVFDGAPAIDGYPRAIKYFFDRCPVLLSSSCADPKNLGPALDADVDRDTKTKANQAMAEAAKYVGYALMYESDSKNREAISWWGHVFGPEFPAYGA